MSVKEVELLKKIEQHYSNLKKVSDYHFEDRGGVMVKILPNRVHFIAYFDDLIVAVVNLVSLNVDYADNQTEWNINVLNNKEVESLRNIKYNASSKKNDKEAEDAMRNIVSRLKNHELSSILEKIESLESEA
jgi:hypothetical protein